MEDIETEDFRRFIKESGRTPPPSAEEMDALTAAYPWFVTARVVRGLADREPDPRLVTHLAVFPLPSQRLHHVDAEDFDRIPEEKIIEKFLGAGEHRIAPPENNAGGEEVPDMAAAAPPQIVTEELAEIYLSQQLWQQARETYEKLSLLYPKKSVYFADIIERINSKM